MKPSTKRIILRLVHLVAVIPVLGYVYQPVAEAEQYQRFTQLVFIPVAILAGYWMYMGFAWAILGAASWIALNYFIGANAGFGYALLAQIANFVARFIWKKTKRNHENTPQRYKINRTLRTTDRQLRSVSRQILLCNFRVISWLLLKNEKNSFSRPQSRASHHAQGAF
jgi:hypothetical protein